MKEKKRVLRHVLALVLTLTLVLGNLSGNIAYAETKKITINKTSMTLAVGKTYTLKATLTAISEDVKWSSSNKEVATVSSSGKVKAKGNGICYISAKAGGVTKKCKVPVYGVSIGSNEFVTFGAKNEYQIGTDFRDLMSSWRASNSNAAWNIYADEDYKNLACTKKESFHTICLGDTRATVIRAYGNNYKSGTVYSDVDGLYHVLVDLADDTSNFNKARKKSMLKANSYLSYAWTSDSEIQIRFYFDKNDKLVLVGYVKGYTDSYYRSIKNTGHY